MTPSERHLECPLCRTKVLLSTSRDVEKLPVHFSVVRLVEIVRLQEQVSSEVTPICQNCEDEEKAVSSCIECNIFLCEFCEKSHKKTKVTKGHKICSFDEMRNGNDDMANVIEGEKKLREALLGIQQLVKEVKNAVTRVQDRRKDVKNKEEENLRNLEYCFNALHAALANRKQQLTEKVTKDSKERDKGLQVQEDELCFLLSQLKSCYSFIDDKIQQGVKEDILAMTRSMLERRDKLTNLKEQTKMYPVVRKPVPVNLKQMDELMKMIPELE